MARMIERGDRATVTDGSYSLVWPKGNVTQVPVHWDGDMMREREPWTVVRKRLILPAAHGLERNDTVIENRDGAVAYVCERFLRRLPEPLIGHEKKEKMVIRPEDLPPGALHAFHREMWMWCSDHSEREKTEWPRLSENGGDVEFGLNVERCFACTPTGDNGCADCLLDFSECETEEWWSSGECLGGLYKEWCSLRGGLRGDLQDFNRRMRERADIARWIAELPLREEKKEKAVRKTVNDQLFKDLYMGSFEGSIEEAAAIEVDKWKKIHVPGDWPYTKTPPRNGIGWTDREDELLVKGFYTMTEALALTHQRNPGVVRGRLHKLLREHKI